MELNTVEQLAMLFQRYGLTRLDVADGGEHYIFEKTAAPKGAEGQLDAILAADPVEEVPVRTEEKKRGNVQKSALVGTLYLSPAEGKPPFVSVGDRVKKGDTLCIIEAMKILNEISAEYDGEILEILAENEENVDFGRELFVIG